MELLYSLKTANSVAYCLIMDGEIWKFVVRYIQILFTTPYNFSNALQLYHAKVAASIKHVVLHSNHPVVVLSNQLRLHAMRDVFVHQK